MANEKEPSAGKAYGFFYCRASKEEIETELPTICELAKTPSQLELSLVEGMDNVKGDKKLIAIAKKAKKEGINYMLQATCLNKTNEETADETACILNQAYQSPLYNVNEPFVGKIVYEQDGRYIFKD